MTAGWVTAFQESRHLYKITCDPPAKLSKRSGGNLFIIATQVLTAVPDPNAAGQFKAKTREYSYRLVEEENIAAPDIVAYHWHPNESDLRTPHLHVAAVPRVHFPTSRVCLEDFIEMTIRYFGVRPIPKYSECSAILDKNKRAFEKMASWKVQHP